MCGIVAVLRQPSTRPAPDPEELCASLVAAADLVALNDLTRLRPALDALQETDRLLHGTPGLRCLFTSSTSIDRVAGAVQRVAAEVARLDAALDRGALDLPPDEQEAVNVSLVGLKDACWAIQRDRLGMARSVADLLPGGAIPAEPGPALDGWWAIQVALASLDRLEVRGRDSAGVHVLVAGHDLDLADPAVQSLLAGRTSDPLFASGAAANSESIGGLLEARTKRVKWSISESPSGPGVSFGSETVLQRLVTSSGNNGFVIPISLR